MQRLQVVVLPVHGQDGALEGYWGLHVKVSMAHSAFTPHNLSTPLATAHRCQGSGNTKLSQRKPTSSPDLLPPSLSSSSAPPIVPKKTAYRQYVSVFFLLPKFSSLNEPLDPLLFTPPPPPIMGRRRNNPRPQQVSRSFCGHMT